MRHVFILNPKAGKKGLALELRGKISAYFARHPELDYTVHLTDGVGAATRLAAMECEKGDQVRLYACGGDGTLQETANGIPAGSDAELAVVPCGSGNDYVRTFGSREDFLDIPALVEGEAIPVDAVDCDGRLSLNIASIGMDAAVCAKMIRYKHLPGVSGSLAYDVAILDVFCHPIGDDMVIEIDGEDGLVRRQGRYFLALAANGQYYGGGYKGAPQAVPDDGVLDFVLVKKIPRLQIPKFLGNYKRGDYAHLPFCEHIRGMAMRVKAAKPTYCNVDGECSLADTMRFSIIPKAFRFVLPKALAEARRMANTVIGGAYAPVTL